MAEVADMNAMLSKTVILLYLCGFRFRHGFTNNFDLDFVHNHHKELSNKTDFICRTHFINMTTTIILSAEVQTVQAWHKFNDFADQLLSTIDFLNVQIDIFGQYDNHSKSWGYFNIIYVDSEKSFRMINPGSKTKDQDFSEYYLVIYQPLNYENQLEEMEAIFAYCWSYYIVNVSIMLDDSMGAVRIFTYFPFNDKKCFSTSAVEIDGLGYSEVYPPKVLNLHGCELIAALWLSPPHISWTGDPTGINKLVGMEGKLLREIAKKMNFTIKVSIPPNNETRGLIFENGTVTGAIKMLQEKAAHVSLGCFRCTKDRSTVLTASNSFYQSNQVYIVKAHTENWATFEVMTYPFDFYIWTIMLTIIINAILFSIFMAKYQPKIQIFVFGSDSGGTLNTVSVWLGYPVIPEPKRNFARYILALWIFTTLILRNAYQGLLYNFLSSNLVKVPPDTAKELAEQNYVVLVSISGNNTLSQLPYVRNGHLRLWVKDISEDENLPILEKNNSKLVSSQPKDLLTFYVYQTKTYGLFHVLKESIFAHHLCFYFTKHSFLTWRFNEILMNLRSFGVIRVWAAKYIGNDKMIEPKPQKASEKLTMHQLEGAFVILCLCLFGAVVVFIVELMSLKFEFIDRWLR